MILARRQSVVAGSLWCPASTTVMNLMVAYTAQRPVPMSSRLLFLGTTLSLSERLNSYGITHGCVIHILPPALPRPSATATD